MSRSIRYGNAQFNYHPGWTRPGGTGEVRAPDPKRPQSPPKPGRRDRSENKRPAK
jgi:hypothetical protein